MTAVPIDNDLYDRIGMGWWDETNPLNLLQGSLTPARYDYLRSVRRDADMRPSTGCESSTSEAEDSSRGGT